VGDGVSGKAEIDTAMRLGTNYPKGPFEWCEQIGIKNVFVLLTKLCETNKRYIPAPQLIYESENAWH
jgi:3-hydroxybutyryl-CoA dehydrogenase